LKYVKVSASNYYFACLQLKIKIMSNKFDLQLSEEMVCV